MFSITKRIKYYFIAFICCIVNLCIFLEFVIIKINVNKDCFDDSLFLLCKICLKLVTE